MLIGSLLLRVKHLGKTLLAFIMEKLHGSSVQLPAPWVSQLTPAFTCCALPTEPTRGTAAHSRYQWEVPLGGEHL